MKIAAVSEAAASDSKPADHAASGGYSPPVVIILTVCTMLATLMQVLDGTIANVALPYMQGSMSTSQDQINWVLTSYIVAAVIMTAPSGFLAARFGRTRMFLISVIGFTVTSICCGASQTLDQIVLFRILQGMFGAALVPMGQSVLFDIYPMERRGKAMALWSVGIQIGPIMGPILGGWLTEHYSWRWVFYVNVPFGIVTAIGLAIFLKEIPSNRSAKLDWLGFGALSLAIGAMQLMLDRGQQLDWFSSPEIIVETVLACLGFYIFLVQSWLAPMPFLPPALMRDTNYVIGLVFMFIVGLVIYATLALLAPYLQELLNYPVITAGVVLAPRGIGTVVAALLCGRILNLVGPRVLMGIGFAIGAWAIYEMMIWGPDVPQWRIVFAGVLQGFGVGLVFVPLAVVGFSTLSAELRPQGTAVLSLVRNLGSSVGISITGTLLERNVYANHADITTAVTPFARSLQTGPALHFWNPATAAGAAALDQEITRQATIISYNDDFKIMFILSLAALPLVLLIRTPGKTR